MKTIRNSLLGMYMDYKISMKLNPVLTAIGTAITVVFVVAVLKIFGF